MPRYINDKTNDVVEYETPNLRLEVASNWHRIAEPAPAEPVREAESGVLDCCGRTDAPAPFPPSRNASLLEWQSFALAVGLDEADVKGKTRDQLRDELVTD